MIAKQALNLKQVQPAPKQALTGKNSIVNAFIAKKEKMMLTNSQIKKLSLAEQL